MVEMTEEVMTEAMVEVMMEATAEVMELPYPATLTLMTTPMTITTTAPMLLLHRPGQPSTTITLIMALLH